MEIVNIFVSDSIFGYIKNRVFREFQIDVTVSNKHVLLQHNSEGDLIELQGCAQPIEYEHIRFKTSAGYCMIVDIKHAECIEIDDDNSSHDYKEQAKIEQLVIYKLGKIRKPNWCPEWRPGPTANKPEDVDNNGLFLCGGIVEPID